MVRQIPAIHCLIMKIRTATGMENVIKWQTDRLFDQNLINTKQFVQIEVFYQNVNSRVLKTFNLVKSCSKVAQKSKSCSKLQVLKKVAQNAKSCLKVAEHAIWTCLSKTVEKLYPLGQHKPVYYPLPSTHTQHTHTHTHTELRHGARFSCF